MSDIKVGDWVTSEHWQNPNAAKVVEVIDEDIIIIDRPRGITDIVSNYWHKTLLELADTSPNSIESLKE